MKTVSDDLFRLIKSLTGSEKGYFNRFASRNTPGEKNNYIILFDAVDSMLNYDEELLKKKLKQYSFIKQLPVYKNYLFNMILESLQSYSAYESVDSKITELIQHSKTLEKKSMVKESQKLLNKAKAMAIKFEKHKSLLEILDCERSLLLVSPDKNSFEKRVEIKKEREILIENLIRNFKYQWLSDRMVMYVEHKGDFRTDERTKEIENIMSDPLIKDRKNLRDYSSKRSYYHIMLIHSISIDDMQKMLYYTKKEIELLNEHKHMIHESTRSYINLLVNYLLFSNLLKNKQDIKNAVLRINEFKRKIKGKIPLDLEIFILVIISYAEIVVYRNNGDMKKGRITANKIEKLLQKYKNEIPLELKVVLMLNTACFYFNDQNYKSALALVNTVINEIPPSFKKDLYDFSKLFHLLIHFELGNYDVIENTIDSTYRFLKQRNSMYNIESALFKFFRNVLKTDESKLKPVYEELLYDLEKHLDEPQSQLTLAIFNFIVWINSNIINKPMAEIIRTSS